MPITASSHAAAALILAAVLSGCGNGDDRDATPGDAGLAPLTEDDLRLDSAAHLDPLPPESIPERPAAILDTIVLEGSPEPVRSTLVRAPDGSDLPFSTYVPEGIEAQLMTDGEPGVRFVAAFAGRRNERAYMYVRMHPPGANLVDVRADAGGFLRGQALQDDPVEADRSGRSWDPADPPSWAVEAYSFSYRGDGGRDYIGRFTIARHGDRFFHVITHYPPEYGDGLPPPFERILRLWRWEDTGRLLTD